MVFCGGLDLWFWMICNVGMYKDMQLAVLLEKDQLSLLHAHLSSLLLGYG